MTAPLDAEYAAWPTWPSKAAMLKEEGVREGEEGGRRRQGRA
jgi:hypothetical protein